MGMIIVEVMVMTVMVVMTVLGGMTLMMVMTVMMVMTPVLEQERWSMYLIDKELVDVGDCPGEVPHPVEAVQGEHLR